MLALSAALASTPVAWADDLAEVNQLMRAGRSSEALTKADQYLAGKPRDPQMRFLRAVILSETGKTAEAIAGFTRLTEDYPELPEPYNNLAVLYAGQNQFDKARSALEMAIRTNPSYATAHENLGDVYARLASQAYSRALQLDAANANLQPKLALIRELFSEPRAPKRSTTGPAASTGRPSPVDSAANNAAASPRAPVPAPAAAAPAPSPSPTAPAPAPAATPAPAAATSSPAAAQAEAAKPSAKTGSDVEASVRAWAEAWASKDMKAYLSAYGTEFDPPGKQSRKEWEDERRSRILGKSRISVKLSELQVQVQGSQATAKFRQAYSADGLQMSSRKTLEMRKVNDRWLIVREISGS